MGSMRSEGDNDPVSEFIGKTFLFLKYTIILGKKFNRKLKKKNLTIFIYSSLQGPLHDCINSIRRIPIKFVLLNKCKKSSYDNNEIKYVIFVLFQK